MTTSSSNHIPHHLSGAASILRECLPLSERLLAKGLTIDLTGPELSQLLKFQKLLETDFSESEWSYLRVASGVKISAVAALKSCLTHYIASQQKKNPE